MADGDCCVVCAGYELARLMAAAGAKVHVYYFQYGPVCGDVALAKNLTVPPTALDGLGWASHVGEIAWVLGTPAECFRNGYEIGLTATMQALWTSFSRTGVPSAGLLAWPPYSGISIRGIVWCWIWRRGLCRV